MPLPYEWLAMLADPLPAQSAIDRLQNAAFELVVEGESYRRREKPDRRPNYPIELLSAGGLTRPAWARDHGLRPVVDARGGPMLLAPSGPMKLAGDIRDVAVYNRTTAWAAPTP